MTENMSEIETNAFVEESEIQTNDENSGWFNHRSWCKWKPTSDSHLETAEQKMLQWFVIGVLHHQMKSGVVKAPLTKKFMELPSGNKLWTIIANKGVSSKIPLVMVHGFGGGIGLWAANYDSLSKKRALYTFDLLGFGRSSRPKFENTAEAAEKQFVDSIEEWRESLNLDKIILLGHSFGGYLVGSYALKYPERVKSLIFADPWGFPKRDPEAENARQIPVWIRAMVSVFQFFSFNPLGAVRAAGPWGPKLIKRFRADFRNRYPEVTESDGNAVFDYIYHCNAGSPSGETGFTKMNQNIGYAVNPMLSRISDLNTNIPVTFIYGARSWMDVSSGHEAQNLLPDSQVEVYSVKGAGHHVYADRPDLFQEIVTTVCDATDDVNE